MGDEVGVVDAPPRPNDRNVGSESDVAMVVGFHEDSPQCFRNAIRIRSPSSRSVTLRIWSPIGDYVLSGGELPAMVLIDCVTRLLPGVLGKAESLTDESFENNLLDYPQYTRPANFRGKKVPDVLLSGNHGAVNKWRKEQSHIRTKKNRPDLFKKK